MGRSLGVLCRQPCTKSLAALEYPSDGRPGGTPSTIAWNSGKVYQRMKGT